MYMYYIHLHTNRVLSVPSQYGIRGQVFTGTEPTMFTVSEVDTQVILLSSYKILHSCCKNH